MVQKSAYSLSSSDWLDVLKALNASEHVLPFLVDGLYKNRAVWGKNVSSKLISELYADYSFSLPEISSVQESSDGTVKFLVRFYDNLEVETVLIPFHKRYTVCLSSQVGCAMNCSFCYTGTQGLKRNLKSDEIVGQYLVAEHWLKSRHSKALSPSVVFMGQGEPLQNLDELKKAISILNDPHMVGIGHRQMTVSTVGFMPGIEKIISEGFPKINFALSLHSPFESERNELIPVNQKFPLEEVLSKLDQLPLLPKQFVTIEYLLIKDFNMTSRHADALKELLGKRKVILNLIPFNPFPGSKWERPSEVEIDDFKAHLVSHKLRVMVRTTKGSDILAACGQLKVNKLEKRYERN